MKDKIHPDYHEITVVMTDGTSYKTRSTYGKPGETLNLEIDSRSHPAWTGGQQKLAEGGQLARFNKRFQGQGLGLKAGEEVGAKPATKATAAAAKPAAAKPAEKAAKASMPAKAEKPAEKAEKSAKK
jgi:large subunit ribosomal protein L31